MKILVVVDDQRTREVIIQWLTRLGYSVDDAESAEDALQLAEQNRYDVVIVDYQMPEHNGLWFMRHANLPHGTVSLLITGHMSRQIVSEMFSAGIRGYLAKPFTPADLTRHLEFYSQRDRAEA
jgi:CheY-like chemotaxis protein